MQALKIPLDLIIVGDRQRQDYGDLDDLAESLSRYGLIQPIVIDEQNNLIAGGRRLAAAKLLEWKDIKVTYLGQLSDAEREELELEENVRRKDMSWQERVTAISRIHKKRSFDHALESKPWGQRQTGELLGMPLSNVNYALWAAARLQENDKQVAECGNMREVIQLIVQRNEDAAMAELSKGQPTVMPTLEVVQRMLEDGSIHEEPVMRVTVPVSTKCLHGNALDFISSLTYQVDHIITDPPYGIDMTMLQQDNIGTNVERTAKEHDVKENLVLLGRFVQEAFHKTKGFCILWCDQANWEYLQNNAINVGWAVQRWPLHWIKPSPCQNGAAQYNFTKRTEIAMVLRKKGATLVEPQTKNYWIGDSEDKAQFSHPFAKPFGLWEWLIEAVSLPGQTILDPFAGSGTCPSACILLGREPIAVEVKDIHYNECVENMKRAYAQRLGSEVELI